MYPFERFTEVAKMALYLAQAEATADGQSYIGTEHLLIGMLGVEEAVAFSVLTPAGLTAASVRAGLRSMQPTDERIQIHQLAPTSRVKQVLELAFAESMAGGVSHVGTGQLLVGLLAEGDGVACHLLEHAGMTLERARTALAELGTAEAPKVFRKHPGSSLPAAMTDVDRLLRAGRAIASRESSALEVEHVLAALLEEPGILIRAAFASAGVDADQVRRALAPTPELLAARSAVAQVYVDVLNALHHGDQASLDAAITRRDELEADRDRLERMWRGVSDHDDLGGDPEATPLDC